MENKKEYKPGDKITIKINGIEFETFIDDDNVQRFPSKNFARYIGDNINLNKLWKDFWEKKLFSLDELQQFYRDMGYSVGGFDEVFGISGTRNFKGKGEVKIENPLWD